MLEHLDEVPWEKLEHAHGTAEDVPCHLRALASPDLEEVKRALHALHAKLFHQGDRYSASPRAIPFLIELALNPAQKGRSNVLQLVTAMVAGECGFRNGQTLNDGERVVFFGREVDPQQLGSSVQVWFDCYRAALPYVDALLACVERGDTAIGLPANYFLSCFRPLAAKLAPHIEKRLHVEVYDDFRMAQLFALHRLHGPTFDAVDALDALLPSSSAMVASMAAMCLGNIQRERTGAAVSERLAKALADICENPKLEAFYCSLPFSEGFAGDIGHVLSRIPHTQARRSLSALAQLLGGQLSLIATMGVVAGTLRATFPGPHTDDSPLAERERIGLSALVENEAVWQVENNGRVFRAYGLAFSRQEISTLVGLGPADAARGREAFDTALGLCREQRIAEALPHLEEAVRLWPHRSETWLHWAWALNELERYEEGAAVAQRGLEFFESCRGLSEQLVGALVVLKRYEECVVAATHGLQYAPDDRYLLYSLACANALLGRTPEALAGVRRTIEVDATARDEIASDPDFDSLRALPEYQALIAR